MKRKVTAIITTVLFAGTVLSAGVLTTSCALLTEVLGSLALSLLGVTPASNFGQTGNIQFSLLGQSADSTKSIIGNHSPRGFNIQVENEDGSLSDCDYVEETDRVGSEYNAIVVLIDDSGSMENSYPEADFGDMCLTCPHDPEQIRYDAAGKLIERVLQEAPTSRIALMDFGPTADSGFDATRVLADFGSGMDEFLQAIGSVDASARVGTPMWDSLAEVVSMLNEEAEDYEGTLMRRAPIDPQEEEEAEETGSVSVPRYIVILGDGDDAAEFGGSDDFTLNEVINLATSRDVVIHAIGLGPASATNDNPMVKSDEQLAAVSNLQRLAEATGGYYASANDPDELVTLYELIATSMTQGYTVNTVSCVPGETADDVEGDIPESGEPVEGVVDLGGLRLPWRIYAP
ncbi:MAG: VWA domain-containing protein [Bradymonadales bacterium]|nr:VWA domain-containing protein [Bradymonadales bacterium]